MAKKKYDLKSYKKTIQTADTPLKADKFVTLDDCLHAVLGMPGLPLSHISQVYGLSDTGKTSLMFHAAAQAQKQGILPVIIITEGKVDWGRARSMGFEYTGDLPEDQHKDDFCIVNESCDFLEDAFAFIDKITSDVAMGELEQDVMIFWDSVGNTLSKEEVTIEDDGTWTKKSTMMKAAKVITERMRVLSKKINDTRKISHPKSVGLMILNQAYKEPPAFPGGPTKLVPYGGNAIWFRSSLVIKAQKIKKLNAKKDGQDIGFGIVSKLTVDKNHLTNTAHSGDFIVTGDQIIPNDKTAIEYYKATHKESWGTDLEIVEGANE